MQELSSGFLQLLQLTQQMLFHLSSERMMTCERSGGKEVMDAVMFYLAKDSVPFKVAKNEAMKALIHMVKPKFALTHLPKQKFAQSAEGLLGILSCF